MRRMAIGAQIIIAILTLCLPEIGITATPTEYDGTIEKAVINDNDDTNYFDTGLWAGAGYVCYMTAYSWDADLKILDVYDTNEWFANPGGDPEIGGCMRYRIELPVQGTSRDISFPKGVRFYYGVYVAEGYGRRGNWYAYIQKTREQP